jgi:hypothetical protein
MLLIGETTLPEKTFRPDTRTFFDQVGDDVKAMGEAYHRADELMRLRDNSTADHEARSDAFDRRAARIRELTGKEIENPYRIGPVVKTSPEGLTRHDWQPRFDAWNAEVEALSENLAGDDQARRELRQMLRSGIDSEAQAITRGAQIAAEDAEARAKSKSVPGLLTGYAGFMGSMRGMFRDPLQVATLGIGGPEGMAMKTIGGRILSRMLTEAAINGGVELAVQQKAELWRQQAQVPIGWDGMWQQVGLAAVFGGGMGGLLQGGGEVIRSLGRATPDTEAAFARVVSGEGTAEDLKAIAEAVNVPVPEDDLKAFSRALEEDAATAATLGASAEPRLVADAVQAIEQGGAVPQVPVDPPPGAVQLRQFRVADLNTDPARFQFKDGGDAEGVTAALRGVKEWIPERADPLIVWEDLDGKVFVGDGHQRSGLARRIEAETGQPITLNAYVFRAADGFTEADVRVRAALKNIGQGSGSAIDAAKVLRSGRITDPKAAGLPPNGAMVRDGVALARLSDDAFTMAVNDVVDPKLAAVVGRLVDDPRLHAQMLDALKTAEAKTIPEAESMVKDMLAEPTVTGKQSSLFGEEDFARMLLKEKAAVRAAALSAFRKDRAVFNRLVSEQSRIAEAGNVLDTAANAQRVQSDAILIEAIDRLSRQVGPVADALNDAARAVAGGERASAAAKGFAENVRSAIAAGGGRLDRIDGEARLLDPSLSGTHAIEPGTPEGADAAARAFSAAGGDVPETAADLEAAGQSNMFGASEATPAGQQILIPGVAEITIRDLVSVADKPMKGGDAPPPAGGLFDDAARGQIDLLDAIPAGRDAEGKPLITTHAELKAQGDRVDYLADVISSCKE